MRTRSIRKNKINVITLGCSKNLYDSEVLMGQLKAQNKKVAHQANDGNIIVINTCGFIDNAKEQSINTMLEYAQKKEQGLIDKLFVMGCLSERYKSDLEKEISNVDQYFGTRDLPLILKALGADYRHELVGERFTTTPKHYAYLKISEGCNRKCSFCAIPLMRGKHRSKTIESLVQDTEKLAEKGVKELILIAQDLTYYGLDLYKTRRLSDLLRALVKVDGIEWIRLHYTFPTGFPMEVLKIMRQEKKICKYLDIPLQHISDPVLKSMRRGANRERIERLINEFRRTVPGITLRTTLIVGYPEETEQDFEELKAWVEAIRFDRLGCFTYSHEENTHAFCLEDRIPQEVKEARAAELMEVQRQISLESNQKKIGQKFMCIFDRKEGGYFVGRTMSDSPDVDNEVLVSAKDTYVPIGDFTVVKITDASDYDLWGILSPD